MGPSYPCRIVLEWTASSQMCAALTDRCVLLLLCEKNAETTTYTCGLAQPRNVHTRTHTHTQDTHHARRRQPAGSGEQGRLSSPCCQQGVSCWEQELPCWAGIITANHTSPMPWAPHAPHNQQATPATHNTQAWLGRCRHRDTQTVLQCVHELYCSARRGTCHLHTRHGSGLSLSSVVQCVGAGTPQREHVLPHSQRVQQHQQQQTVKTHACVQHSKPLHVHNTQPQLKGSISHTQTHHQQDTLTNGITQASRPAKTGPWCCQSQSQTGLRSCSVIRKQMVGAGTPRCSRTHHRPVSNQHTQTKTHTHTQPHTKNPRNPPTPQPSALVCLLTLDGCALKIQLAQVVSQLVWLLKGRVREGRARRARDWAEELKLLQTYSKQ